MRDCASLYDLSLQNCDFGNASIYELEEGEILELEAGDGAKVDIGRPLSTSLLGQVDCVGSSAEFCCYPHGGRVMFVWPV